MLQALPPYVPPFPLLPQSPLPSFCPSALNHLLQIFSSELFSTLAIGELKAGNPIATGSCYGISDRINSRNASMMTKCSHCGEEGRMWERLLLNLPLALGKLYTYLL